MNPEESVAVSLMQRVDACPDLTEEERRHIKRALLYYSSPSVVAVRHLLAEQERAAVLEVVRRHLQATHYLRVVRQVREDAKARGA